MSNEEMKSESSSAMLSTTSRVKAIPKTAWIVGGVLAVIGIVAWIVQLGNQSMAGTSQYPWGFYIAMFYAAASAGAGVLIVGGVGLWMKFIDGRRAALLYALACALFVVASILIVVDLGNPMGILLTYTSANIVSPVFFDALALPLCIIFAVIAALLVARSISAAKVVAVIGIIAGLALLAVEAWLLTTCSGKDAWGVLLGAGPALIQSVALAAAIIALMIPESTAWKALLAGSGLIMVASLVFDVVLNAGSGTILAQQFAGIASTPLFWIAAVLGIGGSIALFFRGSSLITRIAAGCIIVAVPLFKLAIFWGTQSIVAITELEAAGAYHFDFMEALVFAGALGIGVIVYCLATVILSKTTRNAAKQSIDSNASNTQEVHA